MTAHFLAGSSRLDDAGSFRIDSPHAPSFSVWVEEPGVASVTTQFGSRGVPAAGLLSPANG